MQGKRTKNTYLRQVNNPGFLPFVFMRLHTLSFSGYCKSSICRSYENCRGGCRVTGPLLKEIL